MKKNVAVFFGGQSVEHEVSVISAVQAMRYMDKDKYNIVPVYITKGGELLSGDGLTDIDTYRVKDLKQLESSFTKVTIERKGECVVITERDKKGFGKRREISDIDIAFPIVHGTNCEDGTLQGWLELLGLPYVGCDVVSSAVGMDKSLFKNVLDAAGIPVLSHTVFYAKDWAVERDSLVADLESKFGYPMIVKPANLGSSVGISKADNRDQLIDAIDNACAFSQKLLVERAVVGLREINCSVLGDVNECRASECEEPLMTDKILSYKDKYVAGDKGGSKGMTSLKRKLPAEISEQMKAEIQDYSCRTFKALGCCGVVRIDFLIDTQNDDKVYVNEINTIPGSLSFYLWEATGKSYPQLLDEMIDLGFKRYRAKSNLTFTYDTNILTSASPFGAKGAKGSKF